MNINMGGLLKDQDLMNISMGNIIIRNVKRSKK